MAMTATLPLGSRFVARLESPALCHGDPSAGTQPPCCHVESSGSVQGEGPRETGSRGCGHKIYVQVLLRGPDMSEGSGRSPRSTAWFGLAIVAVMVGIGLVALPLASADSGAMTASVYPLQVSVNPSSHTYTVGQSPGVTGTEKNTGSSTFKATACVVSVEVPGSHTFKSGACPGFKPFSVKAGATASQKYSVYPYKITSDTPTGTYHLKAYFKGTVGGKAYDSETVSFTLTVS